MNSMAAGGNPLSHVLPHPIVTQEVEASFWTPDGLVTVLSDQIVMMIAAGLLLTIFVPPLVKRRRDTSETGRLVPSGFANLIEIICEYFRESVARPALGEHTDRFIKYIWSVFFFILTINLLGLIPLGVVSPVLLNGLHIGGTATANIWVTATLAILTMILMVFNGLRLGGKEYLAHFSPGPPWLAPMMVPLEIMGLIFKIFALAMRLFANMVAGHTLLAVIVTLILMAVSGLGMAGGLGVAVIAVLGGTAISLLEVFVAFLQAFIFSYLTTLFIGMSVNFHHDDEHGEAAAH